MDAAQIGLVLAVGALAIVTFFEVRFLRKRAKGRRMRAAKGTTDLSDEAHNALITTKAILSAMERQGIRSPESSGWIREAEMAYERRNYRVAIDLTGKAKNRLLAAKSAQASHGDLAKLTELPAPGPADEPTTKEKLTKEIPPNMIQSKFSIELAGTAIEEARVAGRDPTQALQLLEAAKGRYDAKAYDSALSIARQSKRAAEGHKIEIVLPPPAPAAVTVGSRACASCGSPLAADDVFCRKCGTKVAASTCASCGANLVADDAFCRKCGQPIAR